ncbi:hypothetical protein [Helicobacter pylori]|nr:hypothetical protein [Helicobacter pylori]
MPRNTLKSKQERSKHEADHNHDRLMVLATPLHYYTKYRLLRATNS